MTTATTGTVSYPPAELLLRLHRRFGPVVRTRLGAQRFAYLLGPDANRFVIGNDDHFAVGQAFQGLVPVDGPTSLIVSDGEDHRRRRRLVQPSLHHRQIANYLTIMADNADAVLDTWEEGSVVDAYAGFRSAIRRSTLQSLFGRRLAGDADFFGDQLQPMLELIDRLPQFIEVHRRLRTPLWRRAAAARERVDGRVFGEIDRARTAGTEEDDHVLATLIHGRDADGSGLSDAEIRDQMVTLIAAGYETTSAAFGWTVYSLAVHPEIRHRARAEVRSVLGDRPPEAADLTRLTYLQAVLNESLRLYPPAVVSARDVVRDFDLDGRQVRAGSTMLFSPYVTHRLAEIYPDPLVFRPERWLPESGSSRPGPHEFLPFGGGRHRCIGSTMATTELIVMLARLLTRMDFAPAWGRIRATGFTAMRPKGGLPVRVSATDVGGT